MQVDDAVYFYAGKIRRIKNTVLPYPPPPKKKTDEVEMIIGFYNLSVPKMYM